MNIYKRYNKNLDWLLSQHEAQKQLKFKLVTESEIKSESESVSESESGENVDNVNCFQLLNVAMQIQINCHS